VALLDPGLGNSDQDPTSQAQSGVTREEHFLPRPSLLPELSARVLQTAAKEKVTTISTPKLSWRLAYHEWTCAHRLTAHASLTLNSYRM
jgi:hypothetical protein